MSACKLLSFTPFFPPQESQTHIKALHLSVDSLSRKRFDHNNWWLTPPLPPICWFSPRELSSPCFHNWRVDPDILLKMVSSSRSKPSCTLNSNFWSPWKFNGSSSRSKQSCSLNSNSCSPRKFSRSSSRSKQSHTQNPKFYSPKKFNGSSGSKHQICWPWQFKKFKAPKNHWIHLSSSFFLSQLDSKP